VASGNASTALGQGAQATGEFSIAIGQGTIAQCNYLTAVGYLPDGNPDDCVTTGKTDTVFVVGNGFTEGSAKIHRNALVVKRNGDVEVKGTMKVGHLSITSASLPWWDSPDGTFFYKDGLVYVVTSEGGSKTLASVPIQTQKCPPGTVGCPCWLDNACQPSLTCETGICSHNDLLN